MKMLSYICHGELIAKYHSYVVTLKKCYLILLCMNSLLILIFRLKLIYARLVVAKRFFVNAWTFTEVHG